MSTICRFIGGDKHGEPVVDVHPQQHVVDFPGPVRGTLRYVRHAGHFVIFGMSPQRAAELIKELEACAA